MKSITSLSFLTDLTLAFVLLTRWPMPRLPEAAFSQGARAVWAYPIVGAVLGALGYAVAVFSMAQGLPAFVTAGLVLAVVMLSSGAMHEDGLADTADGLWGGHTPEDRLAIMKDSQIGTYGTLALIVSVGLRWSALSIIVTTMPVAIVACFAISRGAMPVVMHFLPAARANGLSQSVGRPAAVPVLAGAAIAVTLAATTLSGLAIGIVISTALTTALVSVIALRKIGGQTGDILGATQQLSEVSALIVCAAALT